MKASSALIALSLTAMAVLTACGGGAVNASTDSAKAACDKAWQAVSDIAQKSKYYADHPDENAADYDALLQASSTSLTDAAASITGTNAASISARDGITSVTAPLNRLIDARKSNDTAARSSSTNDLNAALVTGSQFAMACSAVGSTGQSLN